MTDTILDPPRDFATLRATILARRAAFPKRLGQVAAYALDHPDEIAFGTAASIAAAAEVQPSTLVRLAQSLGYNGFSDLQSVFRDRLLEKTPSYADRLDALARDEGGAPNAAALLDGFMTAARQSLDRLASGIDLAAFGRAVDLLARADTIYLLARRRSFPISTYMSYAFAKMEIAHQLVASPHGIDAELITAARPGDAVVAISFSPYAPETLAHARLAADRDVPIVAITDSAFSPLVACASEWLEVAETDFARFRSLSASMALTMALTVAVAERRLQFRAARS